MDVKSRTVCVCSERIEAFTGRVKSWDTTRLWIAMMIDNGRSLLSLNDQETRE